MHPQIVNLINECMKHHQQHLGNSIFSEEYYGPYKLIRRRDNIMIGLKRMLVFYTPVNKKQLLFNFMKEYNDMGTNYLFQLPL